MIKNKSTGMVVARNCTICSGYFQKASGLMFSKKKNLIFEFDKEQNVSIHMLFVFFPIWVLFLDSQKKVLAMRKMHPFISLFSHPAMYVVELTKKPKAKLGNILEWDGAAGI